MIMRGIFTKEFWYESADRAIKTGAQAVLLAWGLGDQIANLFTLDWQLAIGAFGGGVVVSTLTSIIGAPLSGTRSPQLLKPPA